MGIGIILAVTAAMYLIVTWLLRWGGRWLLGEAPVEAVSNGSESGYASGPYVAFELRERVDQVEYAARYAAWYSLTEGIPAILYVQVRPDDKAEHQLLESALRRWPGMLVMYE